MTKAKENGHASLTLLNGSKAVTFRHMNVRDHMRREAEVERQRALALAAYPELKKLDGQPGMADHADYPDYIGQVGVRTEHVPWIVAAANEPVTADDVLGSDMDEMMAATAAVMALNASHRLLFPRLVQILNPEQPGPN